MCEVGTCLLFEISQLFDSKFEPMIESRGNVLKNS